ncbi:EAL domain-containing protein (putative c-di-GMP-specific phosphodiesterase class I) [Novosphingobium chloroacetimidivorans]|uniref:EAL domain-containing protein (Putative c-di-GMP-specific phosphodiesterase class I) n=1 Tax=Novosphingobium chloroacetimidivorans TaxID=1428314 RepID=A0A7W7KB63_9SPHN|nr:GGDEF domain-containing phosphodiesterase [Novosphingobium chloroacetimidivorans]MBB4859592.1 EAL domain-containing protein (putative c-di-GMP-specific phosphodiesterase class I) [Novosphingobium chloroacetimidivorans]
MKWSPRADHQSEPSIGQRPFTASVGTWLDMRACAQAVEQALRELPAGERLGLLLLEVWGLSEQLDALVSERGDAAGHRAMIALGVGPPPDTRIARVGRGTLALIFPHLDGIVHGERLAEAVATGPLLIFAGAGIPVPLDMRAGLAIAPDHGTTFETLLARAELAVIELRSKQTSSFATYRSDVQARAIRRARLRQDLERAEQEGQFELFYQPQVDLASGRVVGAEALMRWHHPTQGLLAPGDFLARLEQMSQARRVDTWVLETAASQAAAWNGPKPGVRVAINIFPDRLGDRLVADVERVLGEHGLAPEALEIEIPERHALDDIDSAARTVKSLRRLGVSVALDDFGTGFASLTAISALDVNRLKIDRSFVADMLSNGKSVAIISTLIELGRRIDLSILAEGIETAEQRDVLQAFGCNEGQGYLFGKPMPPEQLWPVCAAMRRAG